MEFWVFQIVNFCKCAIFRNSKILTIIGTFQIRNLKNFQKLVIFRIIKIASFPNFLHWKFPKF